MTPLHNGSQDMVLSLLDFPRSNVTDFVFLMQSLRDASKRYPVRLCVLAAVLESTVHLPDVAEDLAADILPAGILV